MKIYQSDLAQIPPTICPSSLDENLKGGQPHIWDESATPIVCAECGTEQDDENK